MLCTLVARAQQSCPPNVDFETGDFSGWTCYAGTVASIGGENVITFGYTGGPVNNQHTMYSALPGGELDEYGGFPVNCPNGSGYSVRLGNSEAGTQSEGLSYDFTIPAGVNIYNLIYNYAVVFQDPNHLPSEQPRLEIEVLNLTDNTIISCSSFTFFANGSPLPGFQLSNNPGGNTDVWYKDWTAVSVNLDGLAGKKIRLFFKTADCTFRRHFGYAYIDVNTECSDKFVGASFCPDDSLVSVTAPWGYESYSWYNSTFTQQLGTGQILTLMPPPTSGTTVAVVLNPYNGYGCLDTLFTDLTNDLNYLANAGLDKASCNGNIVQIGSPPKPGWSYSWSPATGLNNPNIANPQASPTVTTTYTLSIRHLGGGCFSQDAVTVQASTLDNTLSVRGKDAWCLGSGDSTVLEVPLADSIQWFKDGRALLGETKTIYRPTSSGVYYAMVFNSAGCILTTTQKQVSITSTPKAIAALNKPEQCQLENRFIFINTSTNALGTVNYTWDMGDGTTYTSRDVSHSYLQPGAYNVRMKVNSSPVCADSLSFQINVYPNVLADFSLAPVCIDAPFTPVNKTVEPGTSPVHYLWDFGNGQASSLRNPPAQFYTSAGNYAIRLTVSSDQCPDPVNTKRQTLRVEKPLAGKTYPVAYAVRNLPLDLEARAIGSSALWDPGFQLDDVRKFTPRFKGAAEQLYTIKITTDAGCETVDTQMVKINEKIVVFVPNTFTPNNDGLNDLLRPFMIGIRKLNYFRIYNRWGEMIYSTADAKAGWNGMYKGQHVNMQTVVWVLEGIGADDSIHQAKGSAIVLR